MRQLFLIIAVFITFLAVDCRSAAVRLRSASTTSGA
jgi:hypothetical protein